MQPSPELMEALAVTAEVCGFDMSKAAATIVAAELAAHPEPAVMQALVRLRREHKGRFSLAAVIERIDDGRPTADEAWAAVPRDEETTAVLTRETLEALGVAQPLLDEGDQIAARVAFKDAYARAIRDAKDAGRAVEWVVSLGYDGAGRAGALAQAVEQGRIHPNHALGYVSGTHREQLAQALTKTMPAQSAIGAQVRAAIARTV